MECEYFEKLKDHEFGELLAETGHWLIILAPDQRNLGTCVVALKRNESDLSNLSGEEWAELASIVKKMEFAIKNSFNATMFNWGCLMNSAYLDDPPSPHLHWHLIPRYRDPIQFMGKTFEDPCFGRSTMHNRGRPVKLSKEFKEKIIRKINEFLEF